MTKPNIELKSIKVAAFASEETHCYEATLYVDGVRWGVVTNDGHGGPDNFYGANGKGWDDIRALNERIAATYDKIDCADIGAPGTFLTPSLETICGELVNEHLVSADLKRALKTKLLFTKPGEQGVFAIPLKHKGKVWPVAAVKAAAEKRTPGITVLNELPFSEALVIYRRAV